MRELLLRTWKSLLASLGTTTLAVVVFSVLLPIGAFIVDALLRWEVGASILSIIKGSILRWPTLAAVGSTALVWLLLFLRAFIKTIVHDEEALSLAIREQARLSAELDKARAAEGQVSKLKRQLDEVHRRFSGPKWDRFVEKVNTLTVAEKFGLFSFILQGCRMLEADAQRVVSDRYHFVTNVLHAIQEKTGFITSGFNGYEANPGMTAFLEHWAETYRPE